VHRCSKNEKRREFHFWSQNARRYVCTSIQCSLSFSLCDAV